MSASLFSSLLTPSRLGSPACDPAVASLALAAVRSTHRDHAGRLWGCHATLPAEVVDALLGDDLLPAVFNQAGSVASSKELLGHPDRDAKLARLIARFEEMPEEERRFKLGELAAAVADDPVPVELFVRLFCVAPNALGVAATRSGRPDVLRRAAAGAVAGGRYRWGQRTDPVVLAELARDAEALAVVAAHGGLADVLVANPQSVTVQILDALEDPDGALAAVVAAVLPPTGESDSDSASHLFKGAPELAARAVRFVPTSQRDRLRTFGVDIDSLMVRAAAAELVGKPSAQAMFWGPEGDWGGTLGDLLEASLHLAASGAGSVAAVSP